MRGKSVIAAVGLYMMLSAAVAQPEDKNTDGGRIVLVKAGKPAATIVIDREAGRAARFAAAELQCHVEKITGANLPILSAQETGTGTGTRILVGESEATRELGLRSHDFKQQEYLVRFLPDTLILMGRDKPREEEQEKPVEFTSGYHVLMGTADLRHHPQLSHRSELTMTVEATGSPDARLGFLLLLYGENDRKVARRQFLWNRELTGEFQKVSVDFAFAANADDVAATKYVRLYAYRCNQQGTIRLRSLCVDYREGSGERHPLFSAGGFNYADVNTFPGWLDEQASVYAVYDFLERCCGVRWYLPTDLGLVCPKTDSLTISGDEIRRAPAMKYRKLHRAADVPADLSDNNGPALERRQAQLFCYRQRLMGIEPYACNHAFYGYYRHHLKDHREWFARGYDQDVPGDPQFTSTPRGSYDHNGYPMKYYPNMCFTNEGFIKHVAAQACEFFETGKKDPGVPAMGDFFALGPMDSTGQDKFCKCPQCQALLHTTPPCEKWRDHYFFWDDRASDYVFSFVNKVAREVGRTHPGKYLTMFAYHQNYYPPTRELLEPNVALTFCIHAQLRAVPAMDRAVTGLLDKWDEESRERPKYLWLYFHRPGRANPFFPGFMAHKMVEQMQDYHRRGLRGIFAEPAYVSRTEEEQKKGYAGRVPIVNMLELYIAYKLADNPELDGDQLIDEFFTLYYGNAGKTMQALYESIENVYCDPANYAFNTTTYVGYQTAEIAWGKLGTEERMTGFEQLMEEAKRAAKTETEQKRVALFEESVWQRMKTASTEYLGAREKGKNGLKTACANRIAGAPPNGDLTEVDWSQATVLRDWRTLDGKPGTPRKLEGRLLHDGRFLYVRLEEFTDPADLIHVDDSIWIEDDWELFVALERGGNYRQLGVNTKGTYACLAYGEKSKKWDSGAALVSDTTSSDRWAVTMALPLDRLLPGRVRPGQTIYMNVARGTAGDVKRSLIWIPTFSAAFHSLEQLGAVTLNEEAGIKMEERIEGE